MLLLLASALALRTGHVQRRGGDHRRHAEGDPGRARSPARASCRRTSTASRPTTACAPRSSPRTASRSQPAKGTVRAGKPLTFPTKTVAASTFLPDLDQYQGLPLEFGRMEPTVSDPSVQQQFGMRVGIPNAGQVNALETLNIRGERSVTCKAQFDAHPSTGALPASLPEGVRGVPQAARRARARGRARQAVRPQSGSREAADVLRRLRVEELVRREGHARHRRQRRELRDGRAARRIRRTSRTCAPKARSVSRVANAAKAAARRRRRREAEVDPARRAISPYARLGRPALQPVRHRARAARLELRIGRVDRRQPRGVLDLRADRRLVQRPGLAQRHRQPADHQGHPDGRRLRLPEDRRPRRHPLPHRRRRRAGARRREGLRDATTCTPRFRRRSFRRSRTPASWSSDARGRREAAEGHAHRASCASSWSSTRRTTKRSATRSTARSRPCCATSSARSSSKSTDPMYPDDPSVPNMKYTLRGRVRGDPAAARAGILLAEGRGRRARVRRAGLGRDAAWTTLSRSRWARRRCRRRSTCAASRKKASQYEGPLGWNKYLAMRGDERVKDWASWVANSKFDSDAARAGAVNPRTCKDARVEAGHDQLSQDAHRAAHGRAEGDARERHRRVRESRADDAAVQARHGAREPEVDWRESNGCCQAFTAMMGAPGNRSARRLHRSRLRAAVRAERGQEGVRRDDRHRAERSSQHPMPISLMVWAGPGDEPAMIKLASAYEAATHHRKPPPAFGPVAAKLTPGERCSDEHTVTQPGRSAMRCSLLSLARSRQSRGVAADGAFHIEEATIAGTHKAIQDGRDHLPGRGAGVHQSHQGLQRHVHRARHGRRQAHQARAGPDSRRHAGEVSRPRPSRRPRSFRIWISTRACPSSTGAWSRPCPIRACSSSGACASAFRKPGGVNAIETLNIRGERSVTCKAKCDRRHRRAAGFVPEGLRCIPQATGRARARGAARQAVRHEAGSCEVSAVLRRLRLEELVRRDGHARHGRQRRELRDGRAEVRLARRRAGCAPRARSASR